jgi:periplasmic protein TonB
MLGDKLDIMKTGWLNVVFANRNQAYGAYQLRKDNARTTNKALVIALTIFIVGISSPTIANMIRGYVPPAKEKDPIAVDLPTIKDPVVAKPVKQPKQEAAKPHTPTVANPPMKVTRDEEATKEPPLDKIFDTATPGPKTLAGDGKGVDAIDKPVGTGENTDGGITEGTDEKSVFTAVEIEPSPMGGMEKFYSFLGNKIKYPTAAKEIGTQGRVVLTFVVERDGSLTDIKALRDPGNGLGDEAIRVLKLAPHWNPGIQNGKKVRVQYTIPVMFSLGDQ